MNNNYNENDFISRMKNHYLTNGDIKNFFNNQKDINKQIGYNYDTILSIACKCGYIGFIEELIENKANVNLTDVFNRTPLMSAISFGGYLEIVELLIDKINDIDHKSNHGYTALMIACERGYLKIVKLLLKNKANLNLRNYFGHNAILVAYDNDKRHIINYLLRNNQYHSKMMKLKKLNLNMNKFYTNRLMIYKNFNKQ